MNSFKCANCSKTLKSRRGMIKHVTLSKNCRENDSSRKVYQCNYCDNKFSGSSGLFYHVNKIHADVRRTSDYPIKCQDCGREFSSYSIFQRHTKQLHNISEGHKAVQCLFCPAVFSTRSGRANHFKKVHSNQQENSSVHQRQLYHDGHVLLHDQNEDEGTTRIATETKKKRINHSPRTNSRILHFTDSTSESKVKVEDKRADLGTLFVDVSSVKFDSCSANENVDSSVENKLQPEFEVSSPSDVAVAVQPNFHEILTEMSQRMNKFEEKFENRLKSIELQLQEISQRIPPKTSESIQISEISNYNLLNLKENEPQSGRQMVAAENMINDQQEELMESETDSSDDKPKSDCPVVSENSADFIPDPLVPDLEEQQVVDSTDHIVHFVEKHRQQEFHFIKSKRKLGRPTLAGLSIECYYCKRWYDSDAHLSMHIKRHVNTPGRLDCCHCKNILGI